MQICRQQSSCWICVKLPINNNRLIVENKDNEALQAQNPIVLYEDGTKPPYDVFWRTNPSTINGIMNINAQSPEQQFRFKFSRKELKKIMFGELNELNGISRYSDMYTRLYDPSGSKEERLVHDYNIRYGNGRFTVEDFPMLYSHFMMVKNHEMKDSDTFVAPSKQYTPEPDNSCNGLFIQVPRVDQEAYLKYMKTWA